MRIEIGDKNIIQVAKSELGCIMIHDYVVEYYTKQLVWSKIVDSKIIHQKEYVTITLDTLRFDRESGMNLTVVSMSNEKICVNPRNSSFLNAMPIYNYIMALPELIRDRKLNSILI